MSLPRRSALLPLLLAAGLAAPVARADGRRKDDGAKAQNVEKGSDKPAAGPRKRARDVDSPFDVRRKPERKRSAFWMPFASFWVPGLDQWIEGQYGSAAAYTGVAVGGMGYSLFLVSEHERRKDKDGDTSSDDEDDDAAFDQKGIYERKVVLGQLLYQGAGGLSAYHSFRTAVKTRQPYGEYDFLKYDETPLDIIASPLHFGYLARPTTFIPLAVIAGLSLWQLHSETPEDMERTSFTQADAFFSTAYSYNAGTHEEAIFRGWLMPFMYESWGSPFWSNAAQSVLFSAAHLNTNSFPLPQLLLGYHLGYTTQRNDWRIGESVFIHAWWDVIAFVTQYHYREKADKDKKNLIRPVLWLPPFELAF
jgi:membrane protease YdiL (CAAX protease family)